MAIAYAGCPAVIAGDQQNMAANASGLHTGHLCQDIWLYVCMISTLFLWVLCGSNDTQQAIKDLSCQIKK